MSWWCTGGYGRYSLRTSNGSPAIPSRLGHEPEVAAAAEDGAGHKGNDAQGASFGQCEPEHQAREGREEEEDRGAVDEEAPVAAGAGAFVKVGHEGQGIAGF